MSLTVALTSQARMAVFVSSAPCCSASNQRPAGRGGLNNDAAGGMLCAAEVKPLFHQPEIDRSRADCFQKRREESHSERVSVISAMRSSLISNIRSSYEGMNEVYETSRVYNESFATIVVIGFVVDDCCY